MSDILLETKPILDRFKLDGRVALVTGGAQGIGRAFAFALGQAGAAVAIVDISAENAEKTAAELAEHGIESMAVACDVTNHGQVNDMVKTIVDKWDKLTIGVNNAGIGQWIAAEEMPEQDWDRMIGINLKGVFLCAQAEAKHMMKAGYGKIINTASISGTISNTPQDQAHYNTAKAGVIHLTKSLGTEWAPDGVRVNCISPGYTRTQLVEDLLKTPIGQKMQPEWEHRTPMGRLAEVTELQGALVYLASEASDFVTGTDIIVDGGYCAW